MAHKAKDNKAHGSSLAKHTSTKDRKRPSRERGPFGENNGTVQHRVETGIENKEETSHKEEKSKTVYGQFDTEK